MDWDGVHSRILLGLSFIGCGIAIWMMLHGYGIWNTPAGTNSSAGLGIGELWYVCIGGIWMLCGFILVIAAGQGLITGVIVEFLPQEQGVEHDLNAVPTSTEEVVPIAEDEI